MTNKANILIVDDEVETVEMISFLLESQGYAVIPAYSGTEALEILQQGIQEPVERRSPIDLVILDVRMPDVDGHEICQAIKQDNHLKYIPVIMVTGLGSAEDTARGLAIGADDYVSKPFRAQELVARVKAMLRVRAMEQELLQHTRELAALNEINKAITSSLDLDQILSQAMHGIREILHVEAGSLLLLGEDNGLLEFKKILSGSQERIVGFRLKPGEGIAGHAVQKGGPLLVLDAQNDPRFCPRVDEAIGFVTRSVLCVPLKVKDKIIGAIEVINKLNGQFDENDLWLLNYMAGSVAIALENARLYTELSDFARELEKSQAQLVQAEKLAAMGRLAASIAHEINNPLQAIHNCLHLTLKKPLNEEKKNRYLGMAQEEVERLITIVQRMLEFYRPSKEGMAPTDVHTIIENVLTLSSKRLQHGKITVTKKLASDLPPISAVRDQLKQVFLNLVINAVEAMPQGGELRIETKLSGDEDGLSVAFTDTGVGLSEKEQENIFEPFFTTKATGTGLGLSVSYGIIERHGGRIKVQSELGKGATFTVHLPLNSTT
ncbi:MAG: response regulator [Anaerolineales bacterium]|nr:MAG: response regulator [Anaerolineales bacterium]